MMFPTAFNRYESTIQSAIENKRLLTFEAHGCHRVAEPHVLGWHDGELHVLTYQVGGRSNSGGLPEWRRFKAPDIQNLRVDPRHFNGPRKTKLVSHSSFDKVLTVVDGGIWFRKNQS